MYLFTDRGTPYSYRHGNTYSAHTFKFTKPDGSFKYVKLHFINNQGEKNMSNAEAAEMASSNPDHHTEDLFKAIERGDYPTWTLYVQALDPADAEKFRWNIFDVTKVVRLMGNSPLDVRHVLTPPPVTVASQRSADA